MTETTDLAVVDAEVQRALTLVDPPDVVLAEAKRAAKALGDVLTLKPNKVMMGKKQYLEYEDWQTVGRFYGMSVGEDGDPEFVSLDGVKGFKASAIVRYQGQIISRATAYCLTDEDKWRSRAKYEYHIAKKGGGCGPEETTPRSEWVWEDNPSKPGKSRPKRVQVRVGDEPVPLFQLASMAQTRACAKALRNVCSWVVVLAGYQPTPAEEIQDIPGAHRESNEKPPENGKADEDPEWVTEPAREREPGEDDGPPEERKSGPPPCPKCGSATAVIWSRFRDGEAVCYKGKKGCGEQWKP